MIRRQLEAWNKFIRDRIAQEKGREEDALRDEQAIDSNNRCFRDASKVAHNLRRKSQLSGRASSHARAARL
jgi:hypothetical protein